MNLIILDREWLRMNLIILDREWLRMNLIILDRLAREWLRVA
jgi:hypothetical protein